MSSTLDALLTLQNWYAAADHVEITARGGHHGHGGGGGHFFFWSSGSGGGSSFLLLPLIAIGGFFAYLWRNPDKASSLKGRLLGAIGAASGRLRPSGPTMQFNPPPGWPQPPRDWRPPTDWAPDPSWPPAPPNWQFWVPDDTAPQHHSGHAA